MLKDLHSDINLAYECENECASEMFECIVECGTNTECTSACYRGNTACIDACPCHAGNFYRETLAVFLLSTFKIAHWAVNNAEILFANRNWHLSFITWGFHSHNSNQCFMIFKVAVNLVNKQIKIK